MKQFFYNIYDFPRRSYDFCIVMFHAFKKFHLNLKGEDHRFCKVTYSNSDKALVDTHYFCSCGYMHDDLPEELKEHASLISKITKGWR